MKSLKERLKDFGSNLALMEGRTKGDCKELEGKIITISDYGFLTGTNGEYVVFICKEIDDSFYFGGSVLTQSFRILDDEGYRESILTEGVRLKLEEKRSKNGRNYVSVNFNVEDEPGE